MEEQKHGFRMSISLELFGEIIGKAMGLEPNTLFVTQAYTAGWNRAIEICAISHDKRFPELKDGEMFPHIRPRLRQEVINLEDGGHRIEVHFDGFEVTT